VQRHWDPMRPSEHWGSRLSVLAASDSNQTPTFVDQTSLMAEQSIRGVEGRGRRIGRTGLASDGAARARGQVATLAGRPERAGLFDSALYIEFRVQMGLVDRREVHSCPDSCVAFLLLSTNRSRTPPLSSTNRTQTSIPWQAKSTTRGRGLGFRALQ
jgi:hypothetical protein